MVAEDSIPSAEYLRECFSYDPETGVLTWKVRPLHHFKNARAQISWNGNFSGKRAGSSNPNWRHARVTIAHVAYGVHRVIWALQTGTWPYQIDHINWNGLDNRWNNLREATPQQNMWNRRRNNKHLPRGVRKSRRGPRYTAQMYKNCRSIHLGTFDTPEEAHIAWLAAVNKERGEFLCLD